MENNSESKSKSSRNGSDNNHEHEPEMLIVQSSSSDSQNEAEEAEEEEVVEVMEEKEEEAKSSDVKDQPSSKKQDTKKKEEKNQKNTKKKRDGEEEDKKESSLYRFPMHRVSRIIKSEDPNIRISQEAVFLINLASEKFLHLFSTEAYACSFLDHKKFVAYKHLSSVVSKRRRFDFLSEFVPEKVKAEDALKESPSVELLPG